jgi:RecG-like helicase
MYKPKFYKPVFIKDAVLNLNETYCCAGTILTLRSPATPQHKPLMLTIDDGTGSIPAVYFDVRERISNNLDIGDDVIVYGHVQVYREDVQFKCDKIKVVKDPNIQALWINQVIIGKNK